MSLVQMSLTAGALIVCITVFRVLFIHRVPKRAMILLWEIAMLRLVLPVALPLPFPGIGDLGALPVDSHRMETVEGVFIKTVPEAGRWKVAKGTSGLKIAESAETVEVSVVTEDTDLVSDTVAILDKSYLPWMIYGAVAFAMALGSLYLYFRDSQFFREGLPMPEKEEQFLLLLLEGKDRERMRKVKFRISDRTASPVTYGVFRPAIVFPKGLSQNSESEVSFWLRHELVHIRNHDNLKKVIAHGVLCLHWFNPLVWLMAFLFNRDLELLCDEMVVRKRQESRKDYALALLSMAQKKSMGFQTGLGFGKNAVTERITAVMKFKRLTVRGVLGAGVAIVTALTAFGSYRVSYAASDTIEYPDGIKAAEYVVTADDLQAGTGPITYGSANVLWEEPLETEVSLTAMEDTVDTQGAAETVAGAALDIERGAETVTEGAVEAQDVAEVVMESTVDAERTEETIAGDAVEEQAAAEAVTDAVDAESVEESGQVSEETGKSMEAVISEYRGFGISMELTGDDYQLYYKGEPIYFFADNRIPEEEGFSGRLFLRTASEKNGKTGVVTQYGQDGRILGVKQLSEEESETYTNRWRKK